MGSRSRDFQALTRQKEKYKNGKNKRRKKMKSCPAANMSIKNASH